MLHANTAELDWIPKPAGAMWMCEVSPSTSAKAEARPHISMLAGVLLNKQAIR